MKKLAVPFVAIALFAIPSFGQQKNCDELKTEIAAKLDAKGVKNYTLNIVAPEDVKDLKVVGTCEAGKKRITYEKK